MSVLGLGFSQIYASPAPKKTPTIYIPVHFLLMVHKICWILLRVGAKTHLPGGEKLLGAPFWGGERGLIPPPPPEAEPVTDQQEHVTEELSAAPR